MGPAAQDFRAAFGLGEDGKHISTVAKAESHLRRSMSFTA